ncbi:protein of unknown function DUF4758 [Trinorchestia longiramus]|nr:protein of unknown function DUF4758 [Trinorchestia longiramus]
MVDAARNTAWDLGHHVAAHLTVDPHRLNTYTVRGEAVLFQSAALLGEAQLAPVYNPFGGGDDKEAPGQDQKTRPETPDSGPQKPGRPTKFVTKTVYGFLDFTTTVGSTIMVFSPKSDSKGEKNLKPSSATRFIVEATPTPQQPRVVASVKQRTVIASPVLLQSSMTETSSPSVVKSSRPTNVVTAIPEPVKKPGPRPFRFGRVGEGKRRDRLPPRRNSGIGERRRIDFSKFKKPERNEGSTISPITVTGVATPRSSVTQALKVTPSQVVVTAKQNFASLSLIDRFTNAINNKPNRNNDNDDAPANPQKFKINPDPIIGNDGLPPTGLVTTLGGTLIAGGLTTVHETSVIGTYIKGQYAQVLLSTSRIFQSSSSVNVLGPEVETVKSVIKGSATQFINPASSAALPLEALFTRPSNTRDGRLDNQPSFFKRRGPQHAELKDDPYVDGLSEDDLQRSGTDLRPSFRPVGSSFRNNADRPKFTKNDRPTTFRPRFTPASSFRIGDTKTATHRTTPPRDRNGKRPIHRRRPPGLHRPKITTNRKPIAEKVAEEVSQVEEESLVRPTPTLPSPENDGDETLDVRKSKVGNKWIEIATIRSMHTFRVGTKKNTRFVTFTKTFTHAAEPTAFQRRTSSVAREDFRTKSIPEERVEPSPLFENILATSKSYSTLPPIDIGEGNLNALLQTVTESLSTTETILKTSVLPVKKAQLTMQHTLTQTYIVTRIVTAIKTIPPVEAFDFIPENSLNEFNDKLLAEGTENDEALLPGELEYDENSGTRVKPPPGFRQKDSALTELFGEEVDTDALDQKLNPQLSAALRGTPQLQSTQKDAPESTNQATPQLSPEQLQQLAYLQLMNPYAFGGFNAALKPQVSVTSTPVTVTTDVTTTTTRVLRVIFNARPIYTTLTSTEVVRTTLTTYESSTVTATPSLFGGFPFPGMPFPTG